MHLKYRRREKLGKRKKGWRRKKGTGDTDADENGSCDDKALPVACQAADASGKGTHVESVSFNNLRRRVNKSDVVPCVCALGTEISSSARQLQMA